MLYNHRLRLLGLIPWLALTVEAQGPTYQMRDSVPAVWGTLRPGPYHVGYRRIASRRDSVDVWYPSAAGGARLRFRDYLSDDGKGLSSFLSGASIASGTIDSLLNATLYATAMARALATPLSLILVAHGNAQGVTDQVVLCEYLASHGFAVAATPSPMLRTPMRSEDQLPVLAEAQADDLAAAIGATAALIPIDAQRVAVVGHSFGARAALLLAMRESTPRLKAIVSLDGGIGTTTAIDHFRRAPSFRSEATLPPVLHFSETLDAFMAPDFTLLRGLRIAELTLELTTDMRHAHFTTWGFAAASFPDIARVTRATENTGSAVVSVHSKVLGFLRSVVKP